VVGVDGVDHDERNTGIGRRLDQRTRSGQCEPDDPRDTGGALLSDPLAGHRPLRPHLALRGEPGEQVQLPV
jgi:hypothetical protein